MPTIGWFEILIVAAVAIVVIGPKDFPFMLKKAGSWIGTVKKYISNIQNEVADLELDNIQSEELKIQSSKPKVKDKNKNKDNDKI